METDFSKVDDETLESLFDETDDPDDISAITQELKRRAAPALQDDFSDVGASKPAFNPKQVDTKAPPSKGDAFVNWLRKNAGPSGIPMAIDAVTGKKPLNTEILSDFATMVPRGQSYGLVDEIGGLGAGYLSGLKRDFERGPFPSADQERGFDTDAYLSQRNMLRKEAEKARARNPEAAFLGELLGGFITPGPKGSGFKGGAKAGLLGGALAGAGSADSSKSDDALEIGEKLAGALSGGAFGGAAGGLLGGASDALGNWLQKSSAINSLRSLGVDPKDLLKKFPELEGMTSKEIDAWRTKLASQLADEGVVRFGKGAGDASEVLGGFTTKNRPLPDVDERTLAGLGDSTIFGGDVSSIPEPKFTDFTPNESQEEVVNRLVQSLFDEPSNLLKDVPEYQGVLPEVPMMKMPETAQPPLFGPGEGYMPNSESPFINPKTVQTLQESATQADLSELDKSSLLGSFGPVGDVVEFATLSPMKRLAQQLGLNPPAPSTRAAASASVIQRPMSQALLSEGARSVPSLAAREMVASDVPNNSLVKLSEYLFGRVDSQSIQEAKKVEDEISQQHFVNQGRDAGVGE